MKMIIYVAKEKEYLGGIRISDEIKPESKKAIEELGKLGIPVIRLESDYNEEDIEQLRIRIEAFIELIKLKQAPERITTVRKSF